MKRAVFSVSRNPLYDFWGPLSCVIWREVTGFTPLLILLGPIEKWLKDKRSEVILDAFQDIGQEFHVRSFDFGPRILQSKLARWYACTLSGVKPDDYLLTSDIDIWPLQRKWFDQGGEAVMDFFYANAHQDRRQWPTCYIGGKAENWADMMRAKGKNIEECLKRDMGYLKDKPFEHWRSDEAFMAEFLIFWMGRGNAPNMINRDGHPPKDRIDRSSWPFGSATTHTEDARIMEGKVDAHLPRANMSPEKIWALVRPIFEAKCPAMLDWADGYMYQLQQAEK